MTARGPAAGDSSAAGLAGFTEESVTVGGDRIHYLVGGDADRSVVCLHGGIIDAAHITWRPLLEPLAEVATVYAPNFPGYGPNPMPDEPLSIPRHVETTAALLDDLDLDAPVVAGISMGGGVAVGLGLTHPDRVDHVVALDAMALGSELSNGLLTWVLAKINATNKLSIALMRRSRAYTRFGVEQLMADANPVPEELVDLVHAEVKRPDAGAAFRSLRSAEITRQGYRTDYSDRLGDLTVSTTLVHGRQDEVFPVEWSKRANERIPDSALHVLEDCGHLSTWERATDVQAIVEDVL